jgi:indolepyruvate ferredoxin oxidoreductase alpha subunit
VTGVSHPLLLGDEAVARAAVDAGISAAYSYPGTPSTEIFEYVERHAPDDVVAHWAANEKTAYEAALGVSMMGRRVLVSMKHVGLNVAADAFVNSALVAIDGGLVVAVADDPGMHSSQNEQDTRVLADFARVPCLEPADQQEAYDMTREAFAVSERFGVPVVVRLVTRLAHGRAAVATVEPEPQRPLAKTADPSDWVLIPVNARRLWRDLLDVQPQIEGWAADPQWARFDPGDGSTGLGVITTGLARNHYLEVKGELDAVPPHLHIGAYPIPAGAIRDLAARVDRLLILEEGYPFVERLVRGVLPIGTAVDGRMNGAVPTDGETTPDTVRTALGLPVRERIDLGPIELPGRPPQLCRGCPHGDSYDALAQVLAEHGQSVVMSDIGCYSLGALPPYDTIESCVCMGASVGMAKGASDAGIRPSLAVIGDGTFLHSGVPPLMDAVASDTDMTLLILDNATIGMTGQQPTVLDDSRLVPIVLGLGADPDHVHVMEITPRRVDELAELLRREVAHPGLSVVIAVRDCVESAKEARRAARERFP